MRYNMRELFNRQKRTEGRMARWEWLTGIGVGALGVTVASLGGLYLWMTGGTRSPASYAEVVEYRRTETASLGRIQDLSGTPIYTVATYNLGYLSGLTNNLAVEPPPQLFGNNGVAAIAGLDPEQIDILGLQEVDLNSERSYQANQAMLLAQGLGMRHGAIAINWDKRYVPFPYWPPRVHFGQVVSSQAVLSRHPIKSHDRIELADVKNRPFYYRGAYADRLAQVTEIDLSGRAVIVINVHLEAFDEATRAEQTQQVLDLVNTYAGRPVLVIGDFNSSLVRRAEAQRTIQAFLDAPNLESALNPDLASQPDQATFPSHKPKLQLDYIFYTPDTIAKIDAQVIPEVGEASDHLPVMMQFWLRSQLPPVPTVSAPSGTTTPASTTTSPAGDAVPRL